MFFKGTKKVGPEEYSRIIMRNGGSSNAFTTSDATVYYATMSRDKIGTDIELEGDRMANLVLADTYFNQEKQVVEEERRLRVEDRPDAALDEATDAVTLLVHPYRRPVVGWMNDIQNLTLEDLKDFHRTYYTPNNAFIVVAGDFVPDEIIGKIKENFGHIPRGPKPPPMKIKEPPQRGERRVTLKKEAELSLIVINYHAPNVGHPDSYALDLLELILANGRTSRLFRDLVYEQRIARWVDADYDSLSIDPSTFSISAQVMPGKNAAELEKAIDKVLEGVQTELVSAKELEKAKNQVEAAFVFAQDSNFGQAMRVGLYELTGGWREMNSYMKGIRAVTPEDIQRVAKKYLVPGQRTVGTLIPQPRAAS
jgi:zinc protease